MRNPIHVLKSLEEKASVRNYKYERLYRNLYNPEFYLLAYANIAKSQGSMTQGADGQTLDNMSLPRINRIIESIRNRTYQLSDGKLMETQTANYFSDIYPIDCAVLSANA